ncbi:MAG: hypothetical protein ABJA82_10770 [Myxococcales bacterium]
MQAQETILFLAVAALATALIVVLVAPWWRGLRAREAERSSAPRNPEERSRQLTPGAATTVSGEHLTAAASSSSPSSSPGVTTAPPPQPPALALAHMICPTCRRQFAAGVRYCPYDARVLTADLHQPARPIPHAAVAAVANAGKICPSCARRYDTEALVCGRDGTALVSVN